MVSHALTTFPHNWDSCVVRKGTNGGFLDDTDWLYDENTANTVQVATGRDPATDDHDVYPGADVRPDRLWWRRDTDDRTGGLDGTEHRIVSSTEHRPGGKHGRFVRPEHGSFRRSGWLHRPHERRGNPHNGRRDHDSWCG